MTRFVGFSWERSEAFDRDCLSAWRLMMERVQRERRVPRPPITLRDARRRPSRWTSRADVARILDYCGWLRRQVRFNRIYRALCCQPSGGR